MTMQSSAQIDVRLFRALGFVVHRWAFVEQVEGDFLAYLLNAHPGLAHVITSNVSGSTLTDWIRTLVDIRMDDDAITRIRDVLTRVDEARAVRNGYVHGLWYPGPEPVTALVQTIRWERKEVLKGQLVTLNDLQDLAVETIGLYNELIDIGRSLGFIKFPEEATSSK